jgi:2-polyprenyl-6-methoxyphenol hydroxylase-like FAD-dependent oxidoreductase
MRFGSAERYGYETCMLPRVVLHQALLNDVDEMDIRWSVRVIAIKEVENSEGGILLECEDGSVERADLVIGADGVHSVVKDCLFNKKYQTGFWVCSFLITDPLN